MPLSMKNLYNQTPVFKIIRFSASLKLQNKLNQIPIEFKWEIQQFQMNNLSTNKKIQFV